MHVKYRNDSDGTNRALIDAGIVVVSTLATTVLLLVVSGQIHDTTAANLIAQSPAPRPERIVSAQPTPQSSLPLSSQLSSKAPTPSARSASTPLPEIVLAGTPDDAAIQADIDKKLQDDARLSALGITATVSNGKVILVGTAPTDELKEQVEKLIRGIKGVKQIDNQIVVIANV